MASLGLVYFVAALKNDVSRGPLARSHMTKPAMDGPRSPGSLAVWECTPIRSGQGPLPQRQPSRLAVDPHVSASRTATRAAMASLLVPGIVAARVTRSAAAKAPSAQCRALCQTVARTSRRNVSVESCRKRTSGVNPHGRSIGWSGSGVTRGRGTGGGVVRRWYASERKSSSGSRSGSPHPILTTS